MVTIDRWRISFKQETPIDQLIKEMTIVWRWNQHKVSLIAKKVFSFLFNGCWRDRGLYQELAHLSLPTLAQVEPMAKGALLCSIFLGGNINWIFYWHLQFCTLRKRFDFVFISLEIVDKSVPGGDKMGFLQDKLDLIPSLRRLDV